MLLKLRRTLLLSGIGLITIGAIAPIIASCSKNDPKAESTQEPVYDAAIVQSLFEQFVNNYRALALANMDNTYDESDIEVKIADFEEAYVAIKEEYLNKFSETAVYGEIAKWVKNLAAQYDIVLIEWTNVERNRETIRETTLANANYSDEVTYAANLQDDFFDQGTEANKSFNDYVDDVVEYDPTQNSAMLFPRSHGYTLRASNPLNSKINAAAAKGNLLSQTIGDFLKLSDTTNLITYFATTTDEIFEPGIISYNTTGIKLNFSKTTTQIPGADGAYLDAKNTAYRILTPTAAAALFQYSYLDFDLEKSATDEAVREFKPFDGTKILDSDSYEVSIAMHINSTDPTGVELLGYDNYESLTSTFEYDVIVTDTKSKFSLLKDDNRNRYEEGDLEHQINYFSSVGARTLQVAIPASVTTAHGNDYLTDTLGYNANNVATIVNAFGFILPNIKKSDRASDGSLVQNSRLDKETVSRFYYCSSDPEPGKGQTTSFTERYGTNANVASVVDKWLEVDDADAAIRLQVEFVNSPLTKFGAEYSATHNVDLSSLKISEANSFLNDVLGEGVMQFGVKVEAAANNSLAQYPGSQVDLTLGVYIVSTKIVGDTITYTEIAPIGAHNNGLGDATTTVNESSNIGSVEDYVRVEAEASRSYNQLFFPLFLSEQQVIDSKFCNDLLIKDNLAKHEKIMSFIEVNNIQNFTDKVDELISINIAYYAVSISMVVLYGIKAIFDAIMIATQWYNPVALASSIIQLASDILSIVFLAISISDTSVTIDRTSKMFDVFNAYLEKDRNDATVGYNLIKSKYDAYMAELAIFKNPATLDNLRLEAASRAHTKYNSFADALTTNLFNFIEDSIKQALDIDPEFNGGFQWSVFEGINEFAPFFIVSVVLNILLLVIVNVFIKVAGIMINAAREAALTFTTRSLCYTGSVDKLFAIITVENILKSPATGWLKVLSSTMSSKFLQGMDVSGGFARLVAIAKPIMKISGIAGVILGIMDALFSIGYSVATSVIASEINDLIETLAY